MSKPGLTAGEVITAERIMAVQTAEPNPSGPGLLIRGFYGSSIVRLHDGSLLAETGQHSYDNGRSWTAAVPLFNEPSCDVHGLLRLPNSDLGLYYSTTEADAMDAALGDATNRYRFRWSADEGATWSDPVDISLQGLTQGLSGAHFISKSGRIFIVAYSQFLAPMALWGGSYGTYKGHRIKTETEGHFGEMEVVRVYYSDDCGRSWKANKSWIMGWREGAEKWTDSFVEALGCELRDGRIRLIGRSLIGRLLTSESRDGGELFSYARPTPLMSSDSPARLIRDPDNGNLILVWNQISREENRRGFRRSRLSSAVSTDDGETWGNFKNLFAVRCLADRHYIPPDPVLTPIWGDEEVGELPDDYEMWHYCTGAVIDREVYLGMCHNTFEVATNAQGQEEAQWRNDTRTYILPIDWFYQPADEQGE